MKKLFTAAAFALLAIAFISCEKDSFEPQKTYPKHPWGPRPASIIISFNAYENVDQPYEYKDGSDTIFKASYVAVLTELELWHHNTANDDGNPYGITFYLPLSYRDSLTIGDTLKFWNYFDRDTILGGTYLATDPTSVPIYAMSEYSISRDRPADWLYHK